MRWVVLFSEKPLSAEENMAQDALRLNSLQPGESPVLCFHHWHKDSVTFGHFVKMEKYFHLSNIKKQGWDMAKRPTGGGIVFHKWDLSFSVILPADNPSFSQNTLENYAYVNQAVLHAVSELAGGGFSPELTPQDGIALDSASERFCMALPTKYDLVWQGKKIAGAAQRKTKKGLLHQGTISLALPSEEELRSILLPGGRIIEAMREHTWAILPPDAGRKELEEIRDRLKMGLKKWIAQK